MLDRIGGEVARATTIVRYEAGSQFPSHVHDGGEEFLVLDGVFEDEHGQYPAGTYVRNPPGSRHAPGAGSGCTIFVKLRQLQETDSTPLVLDTAPLLRAPHGGTGKHMSAEIFRDNRETVRIECWAPGARIAAQPSGGLEILCLAGSFQEGGEQFSTHSWLRLPPGASLDATAGTEGCRIWSKEGHLSPL
jgi:anti-sigma factor ChrR (cupin superfamily)